MGINYLIYGVSALIFQIIMINIIGAIDFDLLTDTTTFTILSAICIYILPFPIIVFLMRKIDSQNTEKHNINTPTFMVYVAITFTLMWVGNIIGLAATTGIGALIHSDISNPVQNLINSSDIWLNLILVSILGPIFEEIIFRKFLVDRSIKYGARVSIILSAVIFAFFHGNLNQFFYAFLIGGFLSYVYIKTGKIVYCIILHIIINLMGSVISLFVLQSAQTLISGNYAPLDLTIVLAYGIIIITSLIVGIIGLTRLRKAKFNGEKTQIALKNPMKNMIINPGMILFMLFFIAEIIYQISL